MSNAVSLMFKVGAVLFLMLCVLVTLPSLGALGSADRYERTGSLLGFLFLAAVGLLVSGLLYAIGHVVSRKPPA